MLETLLPEYNPEKDLKVIELEMSNYQLKVYEEARVSERNEKKSSLYEFFFYHTFSKYFIILFFEANC